MLLENRYSVGQSIYHVRLMVKQVNIAYIACLRFHYIDTRFNLFSVTFM